jgi:uncharacterized membrane protein YebE (DUF533 family)
MSESIAVAPEDGAAAASGEPIQPGLPEYHQSIVEVIASKILIDWLRNRQQLLAPYTLDFAKLDPRDVEIAVHAMMAAASADGTLDGRERSRVKAALRRLARDESQRAKLEPMLDRRRPLADVLAEVREPRTAALVYAASLAAIDQHERVNRYYLRYLAARLHLPRDLVKTIEQRFRASGWSA